MVKHRASRSCMPADCATSSNAYAQTLARDTPTPLPPPPPPSASFTQECGLYIPPVMHNKLNTSEKQEGGRGHRWRPCGKLFDSTRLHICYVLTHLPHTDNTMLCCMHATQGTEGAPTAQGHALPGTCATTTIATPPRSRHAHMHTHTFT